MKILFLVTNNMHSVFCITITMVLQWKPKASSPGLLKVTLNLWFTGMIHAGKWETCLSTGLLQEACVSSHLPISLKWGMGSLCSSVFTRVPPIPGPPQVLPEWINLSPCLCLSVSLSLVLGTEPRTLPLTYILNTFPFKKNFFFPDRVSLNFPGWFPTPDQPSRVLGLQIHPNAFSFMNLKIHIKPF